MGNIYLKRNELNNLSQTLRVVKFDTRFSKEQVFKLIKRQDEVYKRYKFYDNFIKIGGKVRNEILRSKKR